MNEILNSQQTAEVLEGMKNGLTEEEIDIYAKAEINPGQMSYIRSVIENSIGKPDMERKKQMHIAKALASTRVNNGRLTPVFTQKETRNIADAVKRGVDIEKKAISGLSVDKLQTLRGILEEQEKTEVEKEEPDTVYSDPEQGVPLSIFPEGINILDLPESIEEEEEKVSAGESSAKDNMGKEDKKIPPQFVSLSEAEKTKTVYGILNNNDFKPKDIPEALSYIDQELLNKDVLELCIRRNLQSYAEIPADKKTETITLYTLDRMKENDYLNKLAHGMVLPDGKWAPPQHLSLERALAAVIDNIPENLRSIPEIEKDISAIEELYDREQNKKEIEKQQKAQERAKNVKKGDSEKEDKTDKKDKNSPDKGNPKKASADRKEKARESKQERTQKGIIEYEKSYDPRPLPARLWDGFKRFIYNAYVFVHNIFAKDKITPEPTVRNAVNQIDAQRLALKQEQLVDNKKEEILMDKELSEEEKIEKLAMLAHKYDRILDCELIYGRTLKISPEGNTVHISVGTLVVGENSAVVRKNEYVDSVKIKDFKKDKVDMQGIIDQIKDKGRFEISNPDIKREDMLIFPTYNIYEETAEKNEKKEEYILKNEKHFFVVNTNGQVKEIDQSSGKMKKEWDMKDVEKEGNLSKIDPKQFSVSETLPYYKHFLMEHPHTREIMFLNHENNNVITLVSQNDILICKLDYTVYDKNGLEEEISVALTHDNLSEYEEQMQGSYTLVSDLEYQEITQAKGVEEENEEKSEIIIEEDRNLGIEPDTQEIDEAYEKAVEDDDFER